MSTRLVSNSQPQVIHPPWPPKVVDYRHEPVHLASFCISKIYLLGVWKVLGKATLVIKW